MLLFGGRRRTSPCGSKRPSSPPNGRLLKDIKEVIRDRYFVQSNRLMFPDGVSNPSRFIFTVLPEEGVYKGAKFDFLFVIPRKYPFVPPQVRCLTRVLNPRIDIRGELWLPMLRKEWKPVFGINQILFGLQLLFLEPDFSDMVDDWEQLLRMSVATYRHMSRVERANCVLSIARLTIGGGYFLGMNWQPNRISDLDSLEATGKRPRPVSNAMDDDDETIIHGTSVAGIDDFNKMSSISSSSFNAFSVSSQSMSSSDDGVDEDCTHVRKYHRPNAYGDIDDQEEDELPWSKTLSSGGASLFASRLGEQSTPHVPFTTEDENSREAFASFQPIPFVEQLELAREGGEGSAMVLG